MILCIVGPTAVGKTALSIALAKRYNGEIINADSIQVYKGLDIGSAKIKEEEKEEIKHHLLDIVDVEDDYTIYDYQKDARKKIEEIKKRGHTPIIVGGSGLYIKAALYDYHFEEEKEKDKLYEELTNEELIEKIHSFNPNIEIENNRRRLVRTLNKLEKNIYIEEENAKLIYPDTIFLGLELETPLLYQRINERVDKMIIGMIDETYSFYLKKKKSKALSFAIGYKEFYPFFNGEESLASCIEKIKKNSRNYAKRQYTFFRNTMDIHWIKTDLNDFNKTVNDALEYINNFKE